MSYENGSDLMWVSDSFGVESCHVNAPDLSFDASLVGSLRYVSTKDGGESVWRGVLKDGTDVGGGSFQNARNAVEVAYRAKNKTAKRK